MNKSWMACGILVVAHVSQPAWADVYKCEAPGKKTEYRPTPCERGVAKVIKTDSFSLSANKKPHIEPKTSPEELERRLRQVEAQPRSIDNHISIDLPGTPLSVVLHVLSDFAGKKLVVDSELSEVGDFKYKNTPARLVLMDLAERYHFKVRVDDQAIHAGRR